MGIQGVTRDYRGFKEVTTGYRVLQGVQGVTGGYKGLQRVCRGYRGVTREYRGICCSYLFNSVNVFFFYWFWAILLMLTSYKQRENKN